MQQTGAISWRINCDVPCNLVSISHPGHLAAMLFAIKTCHSEMSGLPGLTFGVKYDRCGNNRDSHLGNRWGGCTTGVKWRCFVPTDNYGKQTQPYPMSGIWDFSYVCSWLIEINQDLNCQKFNILYLIWSLNWEIIGRPSFKAQ